MTHPCWRGVGKILCVRLDYLGDVLMCTPAIRALRNSFPELRITLLTSPSGAAAVPHIPDIDNVISYEAPWMKGSRPHDGTLDLALVEMLQAQGFDAAVIFTTYSQSPLLPAFLCYLADIPMRLAHCRENPYQMLTHWVTETEPGQQVRHEARRQLDLVATIGCNTKNEKISFAVREQDMASIKDILQIGEIDVERPWLLFHPGATAESRRYPPHLWREAASLLAHGHGYKIVFTGSADEAMLIEQIREGIERSTLSLAGKLSLGQLGAAIAHAAVFVVNNTGPAHMAAAIGTPVVSLYALTNPQHTPWQVNCKVLFHDVSCRFCYKSACPEGHQDCLRKVEPMQVVDAVLALLPGQPASACNEQDAPLELLMSTPHYRG